MAECAHPSFRAKWFPLAVFLSFLCISAAVVPAFAVNYYFDGQYGHDTMNNGRSPAFPFKTIARLKHWIWSPGIQCC